MARHKAQKQCIFSDFPVQMWRFGAKIGRSKRKTASRTAAREAKSFAFTLYDRNRTAVYRLVRPFSLFLVSLFSAPYSPALVSILMP